MLLTLDFSKVSDPPDTRKKGVMTTMTTITVAVGFLDDDRNDRYQCRCDWEEDGTAKMTLISTDKSLAWSGVIGKDLLEDKGFRKKVAGEEDASDKVTNLKTTHITINFVNVFRISSMR